MSEDLCERYVELRRNGFSPFAASIELKLKPRWVRIFERHFRKARRPIATRPQQTMSAWVGGSKPRQQTKAPDGRFIDEDSEEAMALRRDLEALHVCSIIKLARGYPRSLAAPSGVTIWVDWEGKIWRGTP